MPSSNPTTGVGVAAYLQATGTNVTNPGGQSGQGNGASPSSNHPVAQYYLPMSLSSAGSLHATTQLAVTARDVANSSQGDVTSTAKYKSYNDPAAGSPAWYNPSNFAGYNASVASVSSTGLITAIAVGEAIIEVQYPTFANTEGTSSGTGDPIDMITVQIKVVVQP